MSHVGARPLGPLVTVAMLSVGTMVYTFWPYIEQHPHGQRIIAWRESFKSYRKSLEQDALDERLHMHEIKAKIHDKQVDFSHILDDKRQDNEKK